MSSKTGLSSQVNCFAFGLSSQVNKIVLFYFMIQHAGCRRCCTNKLIKKLQDLIYRKENSCVLTMLLQPHILAKIRRLMYETEIFNVRDVPEDGNITDLFTLE